MMRRRAGLTEEARHLMCVGSLSDWRPDSMERLSYQLDLQERKTNSSGTAAKKRKVTKVRFDIKGNKLAEKRVGE